MAIYTVIPLVNTMKNNRDNNVVSVSGLLL